MTSKSAGAGDDDPIKEANTVRADTVDNMTREDADLLDSDTTSRVENAPTAGELTETASDSDVESEATKLSAVGSEDEPAGEKRASILAKLRALDLPRVTAFVVIPCVGLLLAVAGGYLKWQSMSIRASQVSDIDAAGVAKDTTIAMLSYQPDTVEKDLGAARDRLTGTFKDSYTQLTHDVVIPGAKQKHISAVATVPAVAAVSASANHAVVLVFVNQTVVVGEDAPSASASSIRVTLDKVSGRWMVSGFDPI